MNGKIRMNASSSAMSTTGVMDVVPEQAAWMRSLP